MVSDGGHFENLAAYELVRRRCRVIIISDAECDPQLTFEGLGTLIRMCEVDFGATITIDVERHPRRRQRRRGARSALPSAASSTATACADGILIYLKASMTGREDTPVLQYKASASGVPARDDRRPVLRRGSVRELSAPGTGGGDRGL